MRAALPLLIIASAGAVVWPGAQLRLANCATVSADALVEARPDGTVRSPDGALCATYVGPSPAQLQLQPCVASSAAQAWAFEPSTGAVEGSPLGQCLALNTQGDVTVPERPVSTWTCADLDWNSRFHLDAANHLVANCSTPETCGASPAFCVAADVTLGRTLSLSTVVRYWTVETTRFEHLLSNESATHTVAACEAFRAAVTAGWPGASVTWALSWVALNAMDGDYPAIRKLVAGYVSTLNDELTFIPGGYFAPMYNTEEQTNADIHDALGLITDIVGAGYRPKAIIAGYLGARTLAYLANVEKIHVAQATIFSQFNIDYGDGDGGSPYPFYPSTQHYLKPAQAASDFIDCVNLDGWTVDLLNARRDGFADGFNSRMGVGASTHTNPNLPTPTHHPPTHPPNPLDTSPRASRENSGLSTSKPIETIRDVGPVLGFAEQMHATSQHFDTGFALNGEAFVTSIWEISLAAAINVTYLTNWLAAVHAQWPSAQMLTHGEFGLRWRATYAANTYNYSFVEIGSGIAGSDADKELTFFANKAFRLVLLRNLTDVGAGQVIDFTRYDLPAAEPSDVPDRSWNLMNELNMKQSRGAIDAPRPLANLSDADKGIIRAVLPGLPLGA